MALKIFGTDPETQPKPRQSFADDVVGRFRAGHVIGNRPQSLDEWRVTTGDPDVAKYVFEELGGDAPQSWATEQEDNLEVFTASKEVEVILEGEKAIRQKMVLRNREGKVVIDTDGEFYADGTPDPDADLTFQERKKKGNDGLGPKPEIDVYFRLATNPDLGLFRFRTSSWNLAWDLAADGHAERLVEEFEGQPVKAVLALEPVSFEAKAGPRKGQTVSFTKSSLTLKGLV